MKAFEKWKNKNCENKSCPHEASCNGCENIWRAALEWVLRIKKQGDQLAQYEDDILMAIEGEIKRELGEDKTC